jgi:hypothetical protein
MQNQIKTMTPEQQRIAIAEFCGWNWEGDEKFLLNPHPDRKLWMRIQDEDYHFLPDYPNDLNAMHEAKKHLNQNQQDAFLRELQMVTTTQRSDEYWFWECTNAAAAQESEALLRTIGKWKD